MSGAAGSNACPAGCVRIEAEAACRTAAAAAGKTVGSTFVETDAAYPRGCYYTTSYYNDAYFNTHAVGAGNSNAQLLCAVAAPGAPSSSALSGNRRYRRAHSAGGTGRHIGRQPRHVARGWAARAVCA